LLNREGQVFTGANVFRRSVDSVTAFQVQNASGVTAALDVDTVNNRVGVGTMAPAARLHLLGPGQAELLRLGDATFGDSAGLFVGSGVPEGVVAAQFASLYLDHQAARAYLKTGDDGLATGWSQVTTNAISHVARMTRNAAQSIPNNAWTKVAFDTETFDVGGVADAAVNQRFDALRAGKYQVSAGWTIENALDSNRLMRAAIYRNGVNVRTVGYNSTVNNVAVASCEVSDVLDLAVGDIVEMYVFQNNGAALNTSASAEYVPRMSLFEVR
ncbi:MAG: hypothetical protein HY719_17935, partial [Planctomycetes bacterium]|nr:hypothetical protein [Planctomycetota bacterium]